MAPRLYEKHTGERFIFATFKFFIWFVFLPVCQTIQILFALKNLVLRLFAPAGFRLMDGHDAFFYAETIHGYPRFLHFDNIVVEINSPPNVEVLQSRMLRLINLRDSDGNVLNWKLRSVAVSRFGVLWWKEMAGVDIEKHVRMLMEGRHFVTYSNLKDIESIVEQFSSGLVWSPALPPWTIGVIPCVNDSNKHCLLFRQSHALMDGEGFIDLLNQLADEPTDSFSFEDRSWPPVTPWQWYKYLPLRIDYPWFMWQNGIQRDNNWLLEVQNSGRAYFIASEETHCPNDLKVLHGTKRFTVTETLLASICKVVRKASVSRGYAPGFPMDLTVALLVAVGTHKGTFENHSVGAMIPMRSICGDEDSLLQQAKASINEILRKTQFVQTMYVDIQDSFNSWPKSVATFVTKKMSENARIVLSNIYFGECLRGQYFGGSLTRFLNFPPISLCPPLCIMITCATLKGKLQLAMTMDHAVMSRHEGVSLLRAIDDELLSYCKSRF